MYPPLAGPAQWAGSGWPPIQGRQAKRGWKASLSVRSPPFCGEGEGAEAELCAQHEPSRDRSALPHRHEHPFLHLQ
jgi:hypothetical protein